MIGNLIHVRLNGEMPRSIEMDLRVGDIVPERERACFRIVRIVGIPNGQQRWLVFTQISLRLGQAVEDVVAIGDQEIHLYGELARAQPSV